MKTNFAITASLLTFLLVGCGGEDDGASGAPGSVVRDSAGVTIVENERPAPESRMDWAVGSEPSLSIGSVDSEGPDQLYRVSDATRLSDGRTRDRQFGYQRDSGIRRVRLPSGDLGRAWARAPASSAEAAR